MTSTTAHQGPRCGPGDPLFEPRYQAIDARDPRFDGQFFTAVSSTAIYCRPSCPARTPKRENVTFYLTSAAAHAAGYRACKRCLPEASPGTPEWDLRRDATGRAMRLIADGVVDREGVDGLAARLGYTARHLRRLMTDELGAGPVALARARRAQTARTLLAGTQLPVTEVAFASGFGSIRQFNETMRDVFGARPGDLRRRAHSPAARSGVLTESATVRLDLALPVRQPFDAPGVFEFLAGRSVAGIEVADVSSDNRLRYARTLALPRGPGAVDVVATRRAGGGWEVRVLLETASLNDVAPAVARVRRLLDLDADPVAIDAALSADPQLAPLVRRTPGIRVPGAVDPHELLVRAIVGQQISVVRATAHLDRLVAVAGEHWSSSIPGLDRLFPTPQRIIEHVPEPVDGAPPDPQRPLRLPRRSVRAVVGAARAILDGDLDVHVGADRDTVGEQLVSLKGIGPWTAGYVAMRVLGDPDTWLPGDVALVAGARAAGILEVGVVKAAAHRALTERAAAWAPWRSHAVMHLWRAGTAPAHTTRNNT
ncbi:DNA-3-methyladenine glycosylase 2 family protein [Tessaracoccus antarcticus]|uniref:DNA-3-methyladenine glycosylase II n=1 Tax=Tessaracoccus antarcticus TaxID=2479848 RepID=A0A3M0GA79_9ACTN|nr:AlkA N-terminal domain-containing protein [Tessaracoccus antarcticus]RMB61177.1 DNA-3-methyladenine glycosylase 2 family protein [Tessaracoccus antarcticus]